MQKIQFTAESKEVAASGIDVTVVSLGDTLRPANLAPGQWAIAVGANGGSMWQLISRPFTNREAAEAAITQGFVPVTTEVAVRWIRSLLGMGVVRMVEEPLKEPTKIRVSGKSRQINDVYEAYAMAEATFGSLRLGNPPDETGNPAFETVPVEGAAAREFRNWFEERFGVKWWSIKCELTSLGTPARPSVLAR